MTDLRTAAQQALEALEEWHGAYPHRVEEDDIEVAEALRAALAEPVQEPHLFPLQSDRMRIDPVTGDVGIGTPIAEPVQDGCDHCNHPMYVAIKCKVCGRAT